MEKERKTNIREYKGIWAKIVRLIAITMSLYHLYYGIYPVIPAHILRPTHLMFSMVLIFLLYPSRKKLTKVEDKPQPSMVDLVCVSLAVVMGVYIILNYEDIAWRQGALNFQDVLFACIAVILVLEVTRRIAGLPLMIVAFFALFYCYFGLFFPGLLRHAGFSTERIMGQMYTTLEGIYGMPLGVMASIVFLFILFGAFLEKSGAGEFFVNLALGLFGRMRGGPAQAAVLSSLFMGTISGSATANVVTTGSITIPLMKKTKYKPHEAAAIETAASTAGVLTPPVMGSGAFVMSSWTGIPYSFIIKVAFLPAMLYYASVAFYVYLTASKSKEITSLLPKEVPNFKQTLKEGWHLFIPLVLLIYVILIGYSPTTAATLSILCLLPVSMLNKKTRMSVKDLLDALEMGAYRSLLVTSAMACAGIVICSLGITGLGIKFSSLLLSFAGGVTWVLILFVGIASTFLGMCLPITASYIVLASVAASALQIAGIPLIAAHMIIIWFSQSASTTPPVCVTAYAAAGVAGSDPMKTGFTAFKVAKMLYILPFLFAFTPFITGNRGEIIITFVFSLIGMFAITACLERYLFRKCSLLETFCLGLSSVLLFVPFLSARVIGLLIFLIIFLFQKKIFYYPGGRRAKLEGKKSARACPRGFSLYLRNLFSK